MSRIVPEIIKEAMPEVIKEAVPEATKTLSILAMVSDLVSLPLKG